MKKFFMTLVCFATASILSVNAQTSTVALQHNGNVKLYGDSELSTALNAAEAGDTIYLNEGTFSVPTVSSNRILTITKPVTIIGAGINSIINGHVLVAVQDTVGTGLSAHLLDAVKVNGSIYVSQAITGLKLRKTTFCNITFGAEVSDVTIDRCFCDYSIGSTYSGNSGYFYLHSNVKGMNVLNSKIYMIQGQAASAQAANFVNCNIYQLYTYSSYSPMATFMNCIIGSFYSSTYNSATNYINCLANSDSYQNYSKNQGCFTNNGLSMSAYTMTSDGISEENLKSNNYLGTDGTVVGINGGVAPFTLIPAVPKITESSVKVDATTKKLNVTIKVSAN